MTLKNEIEKIAQKNFANPIIPHFQPAPGGYM
jgi:phosphoribosylformylglycinamidine (FGAM) synthase PurS component